jgi:nucleoside phosphorylase
VLARCFAGSSGVVIECCGMGAEAVRSWCARAGAVDRPVILAGLAGGVSDGVTAGEARVVTIVRRSDGTELIPPLYGESRPGATIASSDHVLALREEKRQWGCERGADLVDMESEAFAEEAEQRGWRWGIVRGVSDDPGMRLTPDVSTWIDDRGGLRVGALLGSLIRRPALAFDLVRLRRCSSKALASMGALIDELIRTDS